MRQERQCQFRKRTVSFLAAFFIVKILVRGALSFHPTFDKSKFYRRFSRSNTQCHQKRKYCILATSLANENEIDCPEVPTKSAPPVFDYRKIPPISDTTPCEVIHSFECTSKSENSSQEVFYFPSSEELGSLPKGDRGGYHIVRQYTVTLENVDASTALHQNATLALQNALRIMDPKTYPTLTRARKACRKGMVLVFRDSERKEFQTDKHHNEGNIETNLGFKRGNVGDTVEAGDTIGVQMFLGTYRKKQCYPNIEYSRPQFQLPVLYEDDHLAVVNKPAGVAVYSETRKSGKGDKTGTRKTVHFALPFALTPPKKGTSGGILRRPGIVHRLDKPTSGLLLVAKTKAAMDNLKEQFRERKIQKIYTAIVNGDLMPQQVEYQERLQKEAKNGQKPDDVWNLIDYPVGGKHALTSWKILKRAPSINARDGVLTMIQVRLHTGRYHQIRRHFAWWCLRPLVGDHLYAGLLQAHHFRRKGLFLSSNGVSFLHPNQDGEKCSSKADSERVEVTIDVPRRFDKLMKAEESWAIHNSDKWLNQS